MVRSPLGDTEKRLLGCWGWLGKSKFCRKGNKQPISENMEPVQPGKSPPNPHTYCAHTYTRIRLSRATIWAISPITWLTKLTNCPACIQFDDLVSYLSQARGSSVLWRQLMLLLASWLLSFLLQLHSSFELFSYPQRPPHMSWTYTEQNWRQDNQFHIFQSKYTRSY